MPPFHDRVDILWPVIFTDRHGGGAQQADWSQPPSRVLRSLRAQVQPMTSADTRVVDDAKVITTWSCWLPGDTSVDRSCRVRWDGSLYAIEGEVERWKSGRRVRRIALTLQRIT